MLKRLVKSEFIRPHASIAVIKHGKFPCGPKNRRIALALPVFDIERTVAILNIAETFHHEGGSFRTK